MGKASRRQRGTDTTSRQPRPAPAPFERRPFEGLAGETDWVALREILPAATAVVTVRPEHAARGCPERGDRGHRAAAGVARPAPGRRRRCSSAPSRATPAATPRATSPGSCSRHSPPSRATRWSPRRRSPPTARGCRTCSTPMPRSRSPCTRASTSGSGGERARGRGRRVARARQRLRRAHRRARGAALGLLGPHRRAGPHPPGAARRRGRRHRRARPPARRRRRRPRRRHPAARRLPRLRPARAGLGPGPRARGRRLRGRARRAGARGMPPRSRPTPRSPPRSAGPARACSAARSPCADRLRMAVAPWPPSSPPRTRPTASPRPSRPWRPCRRSTWSWWSTTAAPTAPPPPPGPPAPRSSATPATAARRRRSRPGVRRVRELERADAVADPRAAWHAALLFVDGDLEETRRQPRGAHRCGARRQADMTIAMLPAQITAGGGRGLVVGLARRGIAHLTGFVAAQPLSGMRCLSPAAFEAGSPLARGWGVEVGADRRRAAGRAHRVEVPCELHHRVSGRDWRGQLHRAGQYRDVWLALVRRGWRPWRRAEPRRPAVAGDVAPRLTRAHRLCVGVSLGLLLLVGLSAPNAAQPDLGPRGWARGAPPAARPGPGRGHRGAVDGVPARRPWRCPRAAGPGGGAAAPGWPLASSRWRLLTAPFGSADHTNYAAYGRILVRAATRTSRRR